MDIKVPMSKLIVLMLFPFGVASGFDAAAQVRLFSCEYRWYADGFGRTHDLNPYEKREFLVDLAKGTASLRGDQTAKSMRLVRGRDGGFIFIDVLELEGVTITAIDSAGESVSTEHALTVGRLSQNQYHGRCR